MNKKIFTLMFAAFALVFALSALSSAYTTYYNNGYNDGYYGPVYGGHYGYSAYPDNYNAVDYHYSKTTGSGPYATTKATDYHKTNTEYWDGNSWVKRVTYVRETRETPQDYGMYYQPYYRTTYRYNDPSYYRTTYRYGYW